MLNPLSRRLPFILLNMGASSLEAKKAMEAGKTGKQYTRSMSNPEDLGNFPPENDELSDLPS